MSPGTLRGLRTFGWVLVLTACRGHVAPVAPGSEAAMAKDAASAVKREAPVSFHEDEAAIGLEMRLYEATPAGGALSVTPSGASTPLTDAETTALLARLPATPSMAAELAFSLRPASSPPPRTGVTVSSPLAVTEVAAAAPSPGPLTIQRHAPDGELTLAPPLSLTFSRPMVALGAVAALQRTVAAGEVGPYGSTFPVTLTPTPAGRWRWLGTQTLIFEPDGRFPMATAYTVQVPSGIRAADGTALTTPLSWTFGTPAPNVIDVLGARAMGASSASRATAGVAPSDLEPLLGLAFDQRVRPEDTLRALRLNATTSGGAQTGVPLRLATADEVKADTGTSAWLVRQQADRTVIVRPQAPLAKGTVYTLTAAAGLPSAEGPRVAAKDAGFAFHTYGPLRVVRATCWYGGACPPTSPWGIALTNPLDADAFDPASVTVTPSVAGLQIYPQGQTIVVSGAFEGRRSYTVRLPEGLKDTFGQTLGTPAEVRLDVGPAERSLSGPSSQMVVVDPAGPPRLSFFTTNHRALKVEVSVVQPSDWPKWQEWLERYRYEDARRASLPGRNQPQRIVSIPKAPDDLAETAIDLAPYVKDGVGQLLVHVEPTVQPPERWARQEWFGWVQVTRLGVVGFVEGEELTAWVTDLVSGQPAVGAAVSLVRARGSEGGVAGAPPPPQEISTGTDGLARMPLPNGETELLVARRGADVALLPSNPEGWSGGGWERLPAVDQLGWYVLDDRGIYKPGETAHIRGWMRRLEARKGGDVRVILPAPATVSWKLTSAIGNPLGEGTSPVSAQGGFSFDLAIPATPDLGAAGLEISANVPGVADTTTWHSVQIEEFRTPEFEVVTTAGEGPYVLGEDATVDLSARYYAGGGLPGAETTWRVTATPGAYIPPGWEAWRFGGWSAPWWRWSFPTLPTNEVSLEGHTDGGGAHHLGIHFEQLAPAHPMAVRAEATVMDVNRQAWSAGSDLLLHPADVYVGVQLGRTFVSQGDGVDVKAQVVDIAGAVAAGRPVELRLVRRTWRSGPKGWAEVEDVLDTHAFTSTNEPSTWTFRPPAGGTYDVVAVVRDTHGRPNASEARVWVTGEQLAPDRRVSQDEVMLIPESVEVAPGGVARVLVQAPFTPADGVYTVQRQGIVRSEVFHMDHTSTTLTIPVDATLIPGFTLQVDLVGSAPRAPEGGGAAGGEAAAAVGAGRRVASAQGRIDVKVSPAERALNVKVAPAEAELSPGARSSVTVEVRDAAGAPVSGAELLVAAVDEAVLALTGYQMPDPMDVYYAARSPGVSTVATRGWVWLGRPGAGLGASGAGPGGGGFGGLEGTFGGVAAGRGGETRMTMAPMESKAEMSKAVMLDASTVAAGPVARNAGVKPDVGMPGDNAASGPLALRANFAAVALWAPMLVSGVDGRVTVPMNLPDGLTRYRVMVVAVAGDRQFGHGVADVTARLPLMVRPSPPRFARVGDRFELPVVVQNQTDGPLVVDVAVRADNLGLSGPGRRVTVPGRDRVEVRFPATVARAGTADVRAVAASGPLGDAAQLTLPVQTPATTESVATYGTLEAGAIRQPVTIPGDVWPQYGGLRVSTSTTQLSALTDSVLYLVRYPYDCNEQLASRILGIAALRDVLKAFEAPDLPSDEALASAVAADLAQLGRRQGNDGGFAFWRRGDPEWPFLSIHAAHAMVRAKEKGYAVDPEMWRRSLSYLRGIQGHIPNWYSREAKQSLRAYALYVRALGGDADVAGARKLWAEGGTAGLPAEAVGWLLPTLHDGKATKEAAAARVWLTNHVTETAAGAHYVSGYADGAYLLLHSDRRADGVLLDALLRVAPTDPLAPKLVQGLLAHRVKGRWANTSESTFVLLALDRYFHVVEGVEPNLVARVWLGDDIGAEHTFRGRTTEEAVTTAPMGWLAEQSSRARDVVVQNDGQGRLYYRIGLDYAPKAERIDPLDVGFTVGRRYEAVDDPADVRRDEEGVWHIRAGARLRVRLDLVATMRRYHVALVDPLPGGIEVVNPDLAASGALPPDPSAGEGGRAWWARTWYEHENLRDDRVEAFTSLLWDGVYAYTYIARATTPGRYVVPPTKAEEMYTPETFGRGGGDVVVVE